MYFYGNFIRENNDANGKNNKDRTARHSHPFPILPFFPQFFPPSGGQKFFVAHKFFCLTRFSLISLTGHVAKETPGKEKVKIQWENCRCLWPTAITAARKAASKLISCAAFKLSFTFCLRLQLRLSKTFIWSPFPPTFSPCPSIFHHFSMPWLCNFRRKRDGERQIQLTVTHSHWLT